MTHAKCVDYVEKHGVARTKTAFRKYVGSVPENTVVRFTWGSASSPEERARCIRGAFHRISQDHSRGERCSRDFDAEFQVM